MDLKLNSVVGKVLLMIFGLILTKQLSAQPYLENPKYGDTEAKRMECASNLSTMSEFVKISMYDYAYDAWKKCYMNCPEAKKVIYIYGSRILKHKIENAASPDVADRFLDTLMQMYDKRIRYFDQEYYVLGLKGIDLLKYKPDSIQTGYEYLKKSIQLGKNESEEAVLVTFLQASNILYKSNLEPSDKFIGDYVIVSDILNSKIKAGNAPEAASALSNIETIFAESGAADCTALISIFTSKFNENPDNIDLLKNITALLDRAGCTDSELFSKSSEALYKLEPSAKSAYLIGLLFEKKGELAKAKEYYNKAVNQETDPIEKANYLYKLGYINFRMENYPETRKDALAAIELNPNFGDAYILIGSAYAASSSSCGEDQFDKNAVYWAAVDKFIKAKTIGSKPGFLDKST